MICKFEKDPPERVGLPNADTNQTHLQAQTPSWSLDTEPAVASHITHSTDEQILLSNMAIHENASTEQSPAVTGAVSEPVQHLENPLGVSPTHFAELYGLGSDMEPILMVFDTLATT